MENNNTVLVTGGSGYIAQFAILQLLQKGYNVKTTLRTLSKQKEVIEALRNGGITSFDKLAFIQADLLKDDNWNEAANNCTYILHIASPMAALQSTHENDLIRPAVEGTLRVLKAAKHEGVKRVVMTSNFGAVGYSHKDPHTVITEREWTNSNEKGLSAYNKSKTLAEKAAWDFIKKEGSSVELTVINPVAVFGPSLSADLSGSFQLLQHLIDGSMKSVPNLVMNIIDVRDVADLHIRAMTNAQAAGERFLALAGGTLSMPQIATLLRQKRPGIAQKVSTKTLPDWLVRIAALFNKQAKAIVPMLGVNRNTSNEKARRILSWNPIGTNEEAVLASIDSMIKFEVIK